MAVRARSKRQRTKDVRRRRLVRNVLAAIVVAVLAITGTLLARSSLPIRPDDHSGGARETTASNETEAFTAKESQRRVFPYSVISGGVNSIDELRSAIAADPVVADHYRDFDLSKARIKRLGRSRLAHVSYRVGERVFWTRQALVLPAGERVITDGTIIARTRCGNQVASEPGIISPAEPSMSILDTPVLPISPCPSDQTMCVPSPEGGTAGNGFVPAAPGLVGPLVAVPTIVIAPTLPIDAAIGRANDTLDAGTSPYDPPLALDGPDTGLTASQQAPTPVPEPGSLILMMTATAGFIVRRLTAKR